MAGFLNVVPPLGLGGGSVLPADGGFDTPIPGIRIAGGGAENPFGGFGTPIPALLVRSAGRKDGGFVSFIPVLRLGATEEEYRRTRRTYFTMIGRSRLGR